MKFGKAYNPVTIVGVKYMEHVCGLDVSYKVPAFARVYNLPVNLLPLYNAVKIDPNADGGNARMIDWSKVMGMDFSPDSYPSNPTSYRNYFIESDSNPRKWDNEIVMDLLLSYNMREDPNIALHLKAGLTGKIEHIPYVIINKLDSLTKWAMQYKILGFDKPTTSSGDPMPDNVHNAYVETMNGVAYFVSNGKLFISKYKDNPVFKCSNILDTLKKKIEEASVFVKE